MIKKKENKEKWKRVMAWSNDEESCSENEAESKEVANLCLTANKDEDEVSNSNSSQILLMITRCI